MILVWVCACSSDVWLGRRCATGVFACPAEADGKVELPDAGLDNSGRGGSMAPAADGSVAAAPLAVEIDGPAHPRLDTLELPCGGSCVELMVVARGGSAPYAWLWDDGSTEASRRVCLDADARLSVRATDSTGEIASAELSLRVQSCAPDAGVTPVDRSCFVKNPSLEGRSPGVGLGAPDSVPSDWAVCDGSPDINPSFSRLAAIDGATYLGMVATSADVYESAGATLCSELAASAAVYFSVDVAVSNYAVGPAQLQLWGGGASCGKDELLWTSPTVMDVDTWHTFCGMLMPSRSVSRLVAVPVQTSFAGVYLLVDNFRLKSRCD